jgi:hypothetical protein
MQSHYFNSSTIEQFKDVVSLISHKTTTNKEIQSPEYYSNTNNFKDIPTMVTLNSSALSSSAYSYFDRNSYSSSGLSIDEVLMIAKQAGEEKNVSLRINFFVLLLLPFIIIYYDNVYKFIDCLII